MPGLQHFFSFVPPDLHNKSGAVFNTGEAAFSRPAEAVYLLGINPGGDPDTHQHETVSSHTQAVLRKRQQPHWCAYRDESWNGRRPGTSGMQPRIQHMFERLGIPIDQVPMSNLIFERTREQADLADREDALAQACWPMHDAVLRELQIRVILCLGGKCGEWVRTKLGATKPAGTFVESYPGRSWRSKAWLNNAGLHVIALSHPAKADWTAAAADPTPLVACCLGR